MRGSRRSEPHLYRRGAVWWCYWEGQRWSTEETDEKEAARVVREAYDPVHRAASSRGIEDAAGLVFAALVTRNRAEATRKQAREKLGHFGRLWEGRSLLDIEKAGWTGLQEYIATRLKGATRLTVSHELGYLRQAWKLARAAGWVSKAWDEMMPERFDRGYKPRTRWLTPQEVKAVLASLPPEQAAWVAWVIATGSDVGDVGRAEAGDVDWKAGLVRVRGTKTTFRDRYVPITPATRSLLKLATKFGPPFPHWAWVNGTLRKLALRLGIPHFTPKDLRRTHGHWLRHGGVGLELIGQVLGHGPASPMPGLVYAKGDPGAIAELVHEDLRRTNLVRTARKGRKQRTARRGKTPRNRAPGRT